MVIEHIRQLKQQALLPKIKKKYIIPKVSAKKKAANGGKFFFEDVELERWFKMKMRLLKICDNCGVCLNSLNEKEWRGSQHHILDKALFTSVKTHDLNHIILGFYCCHSQWHTSIENSKKMLIWDYAKRKVQMFIEEVTENHKILEHYK